MPESDKRVGGDHHGPSHSEMAVLLVFFFGTLLSAAGSGLMLVYGTLDPAITLRNVLMLPFAILAMAIAAVGWAMIYTALFDAVGDILSRAHSAISR